MFDLLVRAAAETFTAIPTWAIAVLVVLALVEMWLFLRWEARSQPIPFGLYPRLLFEDADGGDDQ